jgi:hypothetical protein
MTTARMHPSGTVTVTSSAVTNGRLTCYGYGQDDRVINPGDLLILGSNFYQENMKRIETEIAIRLRGRDLNYFFDHVVDALRLWQENKDWLQAPANQPGLDMRSTSAKRSSDQLDVIKSFYAREARG